MSKIIFVCDTPIARMTGLFVLIMDKCRPTPFATAVYVAIWVNRVMLVSLCAETIKPVSKGDTI